MKVLTGFLIVLALAGLPLAAQLASSHVPTTSVSSVGAVAAPAPAVDPGRVAVRVNGVAITEDDIQEQMQRLFPYYSMHGGKVPDQYQPEIRQRAINEIVLDELTYQEAKRRGLTVAPDIMNSVVKQAVARFGSRAAFEAYGKARYGSVQGFERRLRRAILIAQLQHLEIEQKSKVSDARVREMYEKNKKAFLRPESVWLQTISVELPEKPSKEQRELVNTRIKEILPMARATKNYEEFGLLAERVSEDDYRVMMGDHKWVHLVALSAELKAAAESLRPGQVSGAVETSAGYTILRINDRRPQKQMEYAEVRDQLRKELEAGKRKELQQAFEERLRKGARIEML